MTRKCVGIPIKYSERDCKKRVEVGKWCRVSYLERGQGT